MAEWYKATLSKRIPSLVRTRLWTVSLFGWKIAPVRFGGRAPSNK